GCRLPCRDRGVHAPVLTFDFDVRSRSTSLGVPAITSYGRDSHAPAGSGWVKQKSAASGSGHIGRSIFLAPTELGNHECAMRMAETTDQLRTTTAALSAPHRSTMDTSDKWFR